MSDSIVANLAIVRARIAAACARAHRDPGSVRLLPVTKTLPPERVRQAFAAGLDCFGENKVQEARSKAEALADLPVQWSVIGHLQTNKVKFLTRFAIEFQALDSLRLAEALDRRLQASTCSFRSTPPARRANSGCLPKKWSPLPENCRPSPRCACAV